MGCGFNETALCSDETFGTERRKIARGVFVDGIGQCGNGKQEGQTPEPPGGFQVGGKQ